MKKTVSWADAAEYCENTFGSYVDWEDRYFICPECEEPIYEYDWEQEDFHYCPICDFDFFKGEKD